MIVDGLQKRILHRQQPPCLAYRIKSQLPLRAGDCDRDGMIGNSTCVRHREREMG